MHDVRQDEADSGILYIYQRITQRLGLRKAYMQPPAKKRRLRPLDEVALRKSAAEAAERLDSSPEAPKESTEGALNGHEGRTRAEPHVMGRWPAHIFLEVNPGVALAGTLEEATSILPQSEKWRPSAVSSGEPLHLSLSKPLYVRASDRPILRAAVAKVARAQASLEFAFARFAALSNDERTRHFLSVEVGAGYDGLLHLTKSVNDELGVLHLPSYYDPPRFHASFAWRLPAEAAEALPSTEQLDSRFGRALRASNIVCRTLCLKIGKQVERWELAAFEPGR